jgi:hypothetical protein
VSERRTLGFHATDPSTGDTVVIELSPPDADGTIAFREWPAGQATAAGIEGTATAEEIEERMQRWARAGWKLGEPVPIVMEWLRRHAQ